VLPAGQGIGVPKNRAVWICFLICFGAKAWKSHGEGQYYFAMRGPLDSYTVTYTLLHSQNVSTLELADYEHTEAT
jgi:hypothetical protein